ncbi:zf-HC2 domain-containing protein [Antarcticimicrobium sediminis]|uniref:Zf-HC2 domain-containing protein n=1 Tax=Antarcticimicrobium sediminis TaxID=2546227 RepID=A0A4R5EKQ0_9RHOB|nr:zf-HC2 domain-containing protein [Antarcticimicrobium sediminis]TDE35052.1 zf-HC2 domain-containing protein [Antarcticimicrobium sediminis]
MLSCQDVATRASALIDGELGTWQTLQMRLHLAMCKGCHRFIGQMQTTRDLTESLPAADAQDEDNEDRISAILSQLYEEKPDSG